MLGLWRHSGELVVETAGTVVSSTVAVTGLPVRCCPSIMPTLEQNLILIGASALAGAINSVAGGGTILTFPALLAIGQTASIANATSKVAIWPGQLSSLWGLRSELRQNTRSILPLLLIGIAGGIAGAQLLVYTPPKYFDKLAPYLMLAATVLFMVQEPITRWQKKRAEEAAKAEATEETTPAVTPAETTPEADSEEPSLHLTVPIGLFLFIVSLYGGYFGAGIGILTLAAFGMLGLSNIHQMNGIKAAFTLGINGVSAILLMLKGMVDLPIAGMMAIGSLVGGYAGAGIARRIGQANVRRTIIVIGILITVAMLLEQR
ncbi:MAG: sulfite exporter TauE/SafE family protein [Armatimonadaceae bacterium]